MGTALRLLREFLGRIGLEIDQKTASSLLILLLILILIPVGLFLIKSQQIFQPRAAGELIVLGNGGCIRINKDKQKSVDCPLVPLTIVNPYYDINTITQTPGASPGNSASAPFSSGQSKNVNVKNFNNNIQSALDSIKTTGGSVYLPAGTYTITEKIRLFSNTTVFGDGMGLTIIKFADDAIVGEMMANDSSNGQQNITVRDLTLQGPDISITNGCCHGLKLENLDGGFIVNVEVKDVGLDGIYLGYKIKDGTPKGVSNIRISGCKVAFSQRQQIGIVMAKNVVVDNCIIDGTNKHGLSNYIGIDLEPDDASTSVTQTYVLNNDVSKANFGIGLTGKQGESGNESLVSDNRICFNTVKGITGDIVDSGKDNYIIKNDSSDGGFNDTTKTSPESACDIPANLANLPPAPSKVSSKNPSFIDKVIKNVNAQSGNPGGGKLLYRLSESELGLQQTQWKEFVFINGKSRYALIIDKLKNQLDLEVFAKNEDENDEKEIDSDKESDDEFLTTQESDSDDDFVNTATSSNTASSSGTPSYSIGPQFIDTTFQLSDPNPGSKQIWVQILHPDGTSRVGVVNFNLVDKTPQILGLACNLDISKENLKITIEGEHFGTNIGTVEAVSPASKPEVLAWNQNEIVAFLKKPNIPINEGARFKIKLTRPDGFESGEAVCAVDKSLVSLGARIFCREAGKFDATDVKVNLLYNPSDPADPYKVNKIEEKVTIDANGEIANLKTKLQVGKNYAIAIKAPSSLRRAASFTAQEGTTQIMMPDGSPFILPIGDIAPPVNPDGRINTLDRAELIRQWRILGKESVKVSGDFNRDNRVNSIDWACMNYDFGSEDDPIPVLVPENASGSIHIPGGEASINIPAPSLSGSATPYPSPTKDIANSAKIDIGGKVFLDTNRNKIEDIGESLILDGSAVIRFLQLPPEHETGTMLSAEELAGSKILAQVTNNITGANYDVSVYVEKDSSNKFSLQATANNGQLSGAVDFELPVPLSDWNQVIYIPVTASTI